jgi:zona occludens toxin (predicted ATPase)
MPGATTRRGRAVAIGLVVIGLLLAGCNQGNPYSLPEYGASSASPTATTDAQPNRSARVVRLATPPPQVKYTPADALGQGAWVERGRITTRSPAQRAVVTATKKYLAVWVQLSNTWQVDEQALAATASGEAVTNARERAEQQRKRDQRSVGRFIINVSSVRVDGDEATVTGCHFDATSEVDRDGNVLIAPPGGVLITMHLQRTGRTWRVHDWPDQSVPSCDWRS